MIRGNRYVRGVLSFALFAILSGAAHSRAGEPDPAKVEVGYGTRLPDDLIQRQAEALGQFNDDGPPLPSISRLPQTLEAHPSPKDCDPEAWKRGITEALTGRRHIRLINLHTHSTDGVGGKSPSRSDRMACRTYEKEKAPEMDDKRACCLAAYGVGEKAFIEEILGSFQTSSNEEAQRCVREFGEARNFADHICHELVEDDKKHFKGCSMYPFNSAIRYLGCFQLGYAMNMSQCSHNEGAEFRNFLKKSGWSIAITKSKSGSADALATDGSKKAVSAGGGNP